MWGDSHALTFTDLLVGRSHLESGDQRKLARAAQGRWNHANSDHARTHAAVANFARTGSRRSTGRSLRSCSCGGTGYLVCGRCGRRL